MGKKSTYYDDIFIKKKISYVKLIGSHDKKNITHKIKKHKKIDIESPGESIIHIKYKNGGKKKYKFLDNCIIYVDKDGHNHKYDDKKNNNDVEKLENIPENNPLPIVQQLHSFDETDIYLSKINEFNIIYNTVSSDVLSVPKIEFRYFCYRYINYIKNIKLKKIKYPAKYETCIVEFRKFPHIEFLIRNTINRLSNEWCHTIVCGEYNYEFIKNMCNNISPNINIIKLPYNNINIDQYSKIMTSIDFWNGLVGEKILIYQEDTCIFGNNINEFLKYDYIGAPWHLCNYTNKDNIGNGGFSLRTRKSMIDVINEKTIESTPIPQFIGDYMKVLNINILPEDDYFTINMYNLNKFNMPDRTTASSFSTESIFSGNSFGGHCFWTSVPDWKALMYKHVVIQFKPTFSQYFNNIEHRGGWKMILKTLVDADFFNNNSDIVFYDTIDTLYFSKSYNTSILWGGILHCLPYMPDHLKIIDIQYMFNDESFQLMLKNCKFLIVLSDYLGDYIKSQLNNLKINIPIFTLKHPVDDDANIPLFSLEKFIKNHKKKIIQIGQQARKLSGIYLLKTSYKKLWLTGFSDMIRIKKMLSDECSALNIQIDLNLVEMYYTSTFKEYDKLLSKNIVFVELFGASANNVVLECIVRNTPLLINKLSSIVEYLGPQYPLYYNTLDEASELLTIENIEKAHIYLSNLNKNDFNIKHFIYSLYGSVYFIK